MTLTARRLTVADVASHVAAAFERHREAAPAVDRVGLEIEWIPGRGDLRSPAPVPRAETSALIEAAGLTDDARITFEPGGQIEMSPPPAGSVPELLATITDLEDRVRACLAPCGIEVFSSGVDPWHRVDDLGLQTPGPRYSSMQAHFDTIGPAGRRMMRQTAALQVCLDLGNDDAAAIERWRVANLAGPALAAAFANSPMIDGAPAGAPGMRTLIWQHVDPSRTGFDGAQVGHDGATANDSYTAFALDARFIPLGSRPDAADVAGVPLRDLLDRALVTDADIAHHLTTLFPPVRPRHHLEIRYIDAQRQRWRTVAVSILVALLYDEAARREALDALAGADAGVGAWERAGRLAMRDSHLRMVARTLFEIAARAAGRLRDGMLSANAAEEMLAFRERFVDAARTPADDVLEMNAATPEALDAWR